jgi:hypothetical protein
MAALAVMGVPGVLLTLLGAWWTVSTLGEAHGVVFLVIGLVFLAPPLGCWFRRPGRPVYFIAPVLALAAGLGLWSEADGITWFAVGLPVLYAAAIVTLLYLPAGRAYFRRLRPQLQESAA